MATRLEFLNRIYSAVQKASQRNGQGIRSSMEVERHFVEKLQCWKKHFTPFEIKPSELAFQKKYNSSFTWAEKRTNELRDQLKLPSRLALGAHLWKNRLAHYSHHTAIMEGNSLSFGDSFAIFEKLKSMNIFNENMSCAYPEYEELDILTSNGETKQKRRNDILEIRNLNILSFYTITKILEGKDQIAWEKLQESHRMLMRDMEIPNFYGTKQAFGEIRTLPMQVRGFPFVVFPYPAEISSLIEETMQFRQSEEFKSLPCILRAARLHANFIQLHPFYDGNGRIGRLIMAIELANGGYPPFLTQYLDKPRYISAMNDAHCNGEYGQLYEMVLESVHEQLDAALLHRG